MESVGTYEARTHLSELLRRVTNGESIAITKHGVRIAVLVPPDFSYKEDTEEVIDKLREFRKGHTLEKYSIKEMIEEGRK